MADDRRRRSSYFPNVALNKGYSLDSRFMGGLQPSPTGSYFNPNRYAGEGFSHGQINRIQGNLATAYAQDSEFNRLANPRYQTTQDTGYSSDAQFGSGRASPATVQNYALRYGTPTGNGLSTFQTPSGGSITYKPSGRRLSGGAEPTVSPGSADLRAPLAQMATIQSGAYEKGFGEPVYPQRQPQGGFGFLAGNLARSAMNQFSPERGLQRLGQVGTFAANLFNRQPQSRPLTPTYAGGGGYDSSGLTPGPTPYRRYLD